MSTRIGVDQELTREIILDTARELFVKYGYQATSMRKIAKELNCSHGSIYYYFKNKAELFYTLVSQDFALLDQVLDRILQDQRLSPEEKLNRILMGYIEFGLRNQSHYEIMFLIRDEDVKSYLEEGPNHSYGRFANAIYELSGKRLNPMIIWSLFLSLHGFVSHYCKSGQSFEDVRALAESHVRFLLKAIQ